MVDPLSPERREQLAAGYVLGNLSPEEAEEFQQQLATDAALAEEVARLQSVLELMPYALPEADPPPHLRSNILQSAQAILAEDRLAEEILAEDRLVEEMLPETIPSPPPLLRSIETEPGIEDKLRERSRLRRFSPWWVTGAAALLVLILGWENYRLRSQLQFAQQVPVPPSTLNYKPTSLSGAIVLPPETLVANRWDGINQLIDDHTTALKGGNEGESPRLKPPADLTDYLKAEGLPSFPLPNLDAPEVQLLGGNICTLGKVKGVRLTYRLDDGSTLSVYRLQRSKSALFPQASAGHLYIQPKPSQASGSTPLAGALFWEDNQFFYAIVAELPPTELEQFANQVEQS